MIGFVALTLKARKVYLQFYTAVSCTLFRIHILDMNTYYRNLIFIYHSYFNVTLSKSRDITVVTQRKYLPILEISVLQQDLYMFAIRYTNK